MITLSYFWLAYLLVCMLLSGAHFGMGCQMMWYAKKGMFKPEFYPKKPWWWR